MNLPKVRAAYWEEDAEIGRIAKLSRFTSGFHGTLRGEALQRAYAEKLIGVSEDLAGFVYCYHLKVRPRTTLHYLGVRPGARGQGVGWALVQWVFETSPHDLVQLKAESLNALACRFYQRLGFTAVGKSLTKSGLEMTCYEATRQDIARSLHSVGAAASPSRA